MGQGGAVEYAAEERDARVRAEAHVAYLEENLRLANVRVQELEVMRTNIRLVLYQVHPQNIGPMEAIDKISAIIDG